MRLEKQYTIEKTPKPTLRKWYYLMSLGRALDELFQAGVTEIFAKVANKAVVVFEIEHEYVHLDTSSFMLHGIYESEVAQEAVGDIVKCCGSAILNSDLHRLDNRIV